MVKRLLAALAVCAFCSQAQSVLVGSQVSGDLRAIDAPLLVPGNLLDPLNGPSPISATVLDPGAEFVGTTALIPPQMDVFAMSFGIGFDNTAGIINATIGSAFFGRAEFTLADVQPIGGDIITGVTARSPSDFPNAQISFTADEIKIVLPATEAIPLGVSSAVFDIQFSPIPEPTAAFFFATLSGGLGVAINRRQRRGEHRRLARVQSPTAAK